METCGEASEGGCGGGSGGGPIPPIPPAGGNPSSNPGNDNPEDKLEVKPKGVIPEFVLNQLGIICGENVDPLACKVYTDTNSFIYTVSVDYVNAHLGNTFAYLSCLIVQQGCAYEGAGGYRLDPQLEFGPNLGQVTWNRYLVSMNSNTPQPLFRAAWGVNSNGTVEMENFPMASGPNNATVILMPGVQKNKIVWDSQAILFNGNPVAGSEPHIQFITAQTGTNTIQSVGTLSLFGQILGQVKVNGLYMP